MHYCVRTIFSFCILVLYNRLPCPDNIVFYFLVSMPTAIFARYLLCVQDGNCEIERVFCPFKDWNIALGIPGKDQSEKVKWIVYTYDNILTIFQLNTYFESRKIPIYNIENVYLYIDVENMENMRIILYITFF